MKKNYKYLLEDRLTYYLEWKKDWQDWFKHQEINEKAKKKFYEDKKLFGLILSFYFLPLNLLKYYKKKRAQHVYNRILAVITVLKDEINTINKN
tara:strand:- start:1111 stop:1392 length:282 start_codon:yes stop_codon:yes gene_type:complete